MVTTDYLTRLIGRARGRLPVAQPLIPPDLLLAAMEAGDDPFVTDEERPAPIDRRTRDVRLHLSTAAYDAELSVPAQEQPSADAPAHQSRSVPLTVLATPTAPARSPVHDGEQSITPSPGTIVGATPAERQMESAPLTVSERHTTSYSPPSEIEGRGAQSHARVAHRVDELGRQGTIAQGASHPAPHPAPINPPIPTGVPALAPTAHPNTRRTMRADVRDFAVESPPAPVIRVSIGRVEVRAVPPPAPAPPPPTPVSASPKLSLDSYLRSFKGGAR